jgi:hypothetical protein
MSVDLLLLIVALVCLALAALKVEPTGRVSIGWLGLFFWALTGLI